MNAVGVPHSGHGQRLEIGKGGINDYREQLPVGCFAALERELPVIATKLLAGRTVVRVYADASPGTAFEPAELDLKDVTSA